MELLERDAELDRLGKLAQRAAAGDGALVMIGGEAGVGKTSLVREAVAQAPHRLQQLLGACDPLATPVPLGPFVDMAATSARAEAVVAAADTEERLRRFRNLLGRPSLLVVEDAHWMDDASADLLVHLGRRVAKVPALVVVTHRLERHEQSVQLTRLLDAVGSQPQVHRLTLPPLSLEGVTALAADSATDPAELHERTGGNPFFVTEVLADDTGGVPMTVANAVLSRAEMLAEDGRRFLELVSLEPGSLEYDLTAEVLGREVAERGLDEASSRGMVSLDHGNVSFRHDLARIAMADAMPAARRQHGHQALIAALESSGVPDPARRVHHAAAVGDDERLRRYAPEAARQAAERGAHRSAAAHHQMLLDRFATTLTNRERAEHLEALATESEWFEAPEVTVQLREETAAAHHTAGNPAREALQWLAVSRLLAIAGESARLEEMAARIHGLIDGLPMDGVTADVRIGLIGIRSDLEPPEAWIDDARELARVGDEVGNPMVRAWALERQAWGSILAGCLQDGLRVAQGALEVVREVSPSTVLTYAHNFAYVLCEAHELKTAEDMVAMGLASAEDGDHDFMRGLTLATLMRIHIDRGRWDAATRVAEELRGLGSEFLGAISAYGRGVVAMRRGATGSAALIDEAAGTMDASGRLNEMWRLAAARGEAAWIAGERDTIPDLVRPALDFASRRNHRWALGELGYWLWRANPDAPTDAPGTPWAAMMEGDWKAAANAWATHGNPYLEALALTDGDEEAQRRAIGIADELGAAPLADRVRRQLRADGAADVPVRPRVHGDDLTRRQVDVLELVADGLTNAQIGERLFISAKTAGHHVSSIIERLGVRNRTEAVTTARNRGLID